MQLVDAGAQYLAEMGVPEDASTNEPTAPTVNTLAQIMAVCMVIEVVPRSSKKKKKTAASAAAAARAATAGAGGAHEEDAGTDEEAEAADVEKRNGKPQLKTKLADMPHHNEMMELNKMLLNCMRNPTFCPSTDPIICEYQRQNPYQPEVGKKAAEPKRRKTKDSQFISNVLSMDGFD